MKNSKIKIVKLKNQLLIFCLHKSKNICFWLTDKNKMFRFEYISENQNINHYIHSNIRHSIFFSDSFAQKQNSFPTKFVNFENVPLFLSMCRIDLLVVIKHFEPLNEGIHIFIILRLRILI